MIGFFGFSINSVFVNLLSLGSTFGQEEDRVDPVSSLSRRSIIILFMALHHPLDSRHAYKHNGTSPYNIPSR